MSYQVIARKWRPQAFEEVTGQEHITQTLRNAIEHGRLHHAYLFSGARGVGKTTTARLLAKALNCHKTEAPTVSPCLAGSPDACPSCVEITESRSIDVLEFDAASNTQVDKIREIILESINIAPARDRYKIFIIDEVHMLSASSFNALLKTVEEPPPRVVFIMATTELHKVPDTIASRCQEFQFRTIAPQKIFDRLKLIADAEAVKISDEALREIARSGEGSMRDAQSHFDQVISFAGEEISADDVTNALGIAGVEMLSRVADAVAKQDPKTVLYVVDDLIARGQDLRNFCRDLMALFRDMTVFKVAGSADGLLDNAIVGTDKIKELAEPFSGHDLIRIFNSLAQTEAKLKDATQSRYTLELGLVRLVEMRRLAPIESILERLSALESGSVAPTPNPLTSAQATTKAAPAGQAAAEEKKTLVSKPAVPEEPPMPEFTAFEEPPMPESEPFEPASPVFEISDENWRAALPEDLRQRRSGIDLSFVENLPAKLPPISLDELEHIDDPKLDEAFEQALSDSGDDLLPIKDAEKLAAQVSGISVKIKATDGTAAAPARDLSAYAPPELEPIDDNAPLPELSAQPTDEELLAYAKAHPSVRRAMRIFRAEIVQVARD